MRHRELSERRLGPPQWAAACIAVAAYAGLSHYCNSSPDRGDLGAALALAPLTLLAAILAWRQTPPPAAALICAGLATLIVGLWPVLRGNYPLINLVQDSSVYGCMALTFGRSLLPGRVALCTVLADKERGPLAPDEVRYTRRVTAAWTVFFVAIATGSVLLYAMAPLRIWSFYINFCVLPLVAGMFLVEYLVRCRVLPEARRAGLLATLRVYFATGH